MSKLWEAFAEREQTITMRTKKRRNRNSRKHGSGLPWGQACSPFLASSRWRLHFSSSWLTTQAGSRMKTSVISLVEPTQTLFLPTIASPPSGRQVQEDPPRRDVAQPYKGRKAWARLPSEIILTSTATERRDNSRNARVENVKGDGVARGKQKMVDGGLYFVKSPILSISSCMIIAILVKGIDANVFFRSDIGLFSHSI